MKSIRSEVVAITAVFALLAGGMWISGCGKKGGQSAAKEEAPTAGTAGQATGNEPGEMGGMEHGQGGETATPVTPAADVPGIWSQIAQQEQELSTVIQNGQLEHVHHLAFAIRDLVQAAAAKTAGLGAGNATALNTAVAAIGESAGKLDEYGDSGNLTSTKDEFAHMQTLLQQVKTLTMR